MRYEVRALTFGEILDGAFHLYREHLGPSVTLALALTLPAMVMEPVLFYVVAGRWLPVGKGATLDQALLDLKVLGLWMPFMIACYEVQTAALTAGFARAYLGQQVSVGSSMGAAMRRLGPLFLSTLVISLAVGLGTLLLFVPGVLLYLRWSLTTQAIMVEGLGAWSGMSRSKALMKGRRDRMFGLILLLGLASTLLSLGLAALLPQAITSIPVLGLVLKQLPTALLAPLYPAAMTLFYFDARVRDEGFDLQVLGQQALDAGAPNAG